MDHFHRSETRDLMRSLFDAVHIFIITSLTNTLNIVTTDTHRSAKWSLTQMFSEENAFPVTHRPSLSDWATETHGWVGTPSLVSYSRGLGPETGYTDLDCQCFLQSSQENVGIVLQMKLREDPFQYIIHPTIYPIYT